MLLQVKQIYKGLSPPPLSISVLFNWKKENWPARTVDSMLALSPGRNPGGVWGEYVTLQNAPLR